MSSDKWIESRRKDMKKKITILTLCAMLSALCFPRRAQQPNESPPDRIPKRFLCFRPTRPASRHFSMACAILGT